MYVDVAVNLPPVQGTFHYHLPPELRGRVRPGHLVTAPFGSRHVQGIVVRLVETPAVPETRAVDGLVDPEPVLTPGLLQLADWLQAQTLSPLIDCLTLMLPPGLSQRADMRYRMEAAEIEPRTKVQERLIRLLDRRGPLRGRQIARALPRQDWRRAASALVRRGALSQESVLDPPRVGPKRVNTARLAVVPEVARAAFGDLGRPGQAASGRRRAVLETLIREREPLESTWVYAETGAKLADLRYLEKLGLISLSDAEIWRDPLEEVEFVPADPPRLTFEQEAAWSSLRNGLQKPPAAFLLHGVTGSGKTEIYLRAVAEALALGRSAIVLVPEIALTPQTVRRFLARFPGQVGLLHSQLSEGERYDTWRRCRSGELHVVIGPRSALFAPLPDIGLVVVDEAHDESYKEQSRSPRYHARQTALAYARLLGAVCVLGSATPDVTTYYRSERADLKRLELPQRILGHRERIGRQAARLGLKPRYQPLGEQAEFVDLPPVRVVDMRQELRAGNTSLFSRPLHRALAEVLDAGQQAILFLNRRGAATYVFCRDCGWVARCPQCDAPLTYHSADSRLQCHRCGYARRSPEVCPNCGSHRVKHFGAGTQRIEAEVSRAFPGARVLRWDWDATRRQGSHEVILAHFAAHRADVLVGTQMIAKGLDLPLVTLVGVVSADTGLNLPDYRAAERTFQLLTQVAGRAGRGILGGRVILQTFHPDHYAVQAASRHDYAAFYAQELRHRRELGYPPFYRLARLVFHHINAGAAERQAKEMAGKLKRAIARERSRAELIGPAPCFFQRVRGEYRWQVVIRAPDPRPFIPEELPVGWQIDVDPVSLL